MFRLTLIILITATFSQAGFAQNRGDGSTKKVLSQNTGNYTTTTTIIENADLVGDHEIDTGRFVILKYMHSFDIPNVSDEEYETCIFIKLRSIDNLLLNKTYHLPDSSVLVSTYYQSAWSYSETRKISGTITRTKNVDSIQEFDFQLNFSDKKGKTDSLLYGNLQFRNDIDYFAKNYQEYNGVYDNLRIALKEPLKVKQLDLSYGGVWKYQKNITGKQELPSEIEKLKNLEEFNLQLQNLRRLPSEFSKLSNLKILDISYNDFDSFPTEIFFCEKLDSLNLALSHITEVPDGMAGLKKLKKLNLDDNNLSGFPLAVTSLSGLKDLSIRNGNVNAIPEEIGKLTNLEKLYLGNFWNYSRKNKCNNLESLAQLVNLKELNLEWTRIKSLPTEFSRLKNLEILNIKYNNFKSFPEVIDRIPNLKLLIIGWQEFDKKTMAELRKQKKKYKVLIEST